jgi:hypothetical protein
MRASRGVTMHFEAEEKKKKEEEKKEAFLM